MACSEPLSSVGENMSVDASPRKPRILLAASGSVAAIKFANICRSFSEWGEVRAVATNASLHFIDRTEIPKDVVLYTDEDEWSSWKKLGDGVLHIELRKWADIMVIAPLSANTLGKIVGGLCDNLLTSIVRARDYDKPFFVAPAMNTFMWNNPFTERHLISIDELGISLIIVLYQLTAVPSLMRTILPVLQTHADMRIESSLKLLVLSGETFPFTLWEKLSSILPKTLILNLYGSTKVSGDCTYFDCKRIPPILKEETLVSVPIGLPITNCDVVLIGENGASNEGELYVGGSCISRGYFNESNIMFDEFVKSPQSYGCEHSVNACQSQLYFRTGDLVKQLPSGDFIFLGRKDRIIKVHGQRIALEEVENVLREHPYIYDAAVICQNLQEELVLIEDVNLELIWKY